MLRIAAHRGFHALIVLIGIGIAGAPSTPRAQSVDIDAWVIAEMTRQHIPALSYAIVRDGAVVKSGARGLANVELSAPATDATEFAIASVSKSVTASAVLLLAQDGVLSQA